MKPGIPNQQRLLQEILEERDRLTRGASKEKLGAYLRVFRSADGKKVLTDIKSSYSGISFVPGYSDVTAFKEGRRSVADDIDTIIATAEVMELQEAQEGGGENVR